ncbi:hypothetical protein RIF29_38883 [Crotalaria pallida]|uniref:F-box domain-containing protein n=1 Tax=Crotalaria pallida TaxID=3830 RepID=A0AAN9HLZ1_CROPI
MSHQLPKRQRANNGSEDIFSKLPESLISRILSLLSTKDAFRTSVLSKKWRHRWTCITKLVMDDSDFYSRKKTKQCFLNFMYRILLLTKWESFSLVIGANKYDASLVNAWISSILHRTVRNLCIKSKLELSFSALTSHFLFNCRSLEELVLEMTLCAVVVPSIFLYFGQLKFLKLSGITFTHEDPNYSESLKLHFPVLKKFETINCTWSFSKGITVDAPLLESVLINQYPKSLPYKPNMCAIKFSAPKLKNFTYHVDGHISPDVVLLDRSSAHNASANITLYICNDRVAETGNCIILLLKQLNQVLAKSRLDILHSFVMLSHLELGLVTCEVLLGLLLKSPVLKTMVFKGLSKFDQELLNSASVPDCFVSTLQMVKIGRVHGYDHELCFAKFVMENGLVLERLNFGALPYNLKAIEEFKEKLFSFKKGFKSYAIVDFSYGY